MKDIKLKNPNTYRLLPDNEIVASEKDLENISEDTLVSYAFGGVTATSPHKSLMEMIQSFKDDSRKSAKWVRKSATKAIKLAKKKADRGGTFSDKERADFANDVCIVVCINNALDGIPIPVTGIVQT